MKEAIKERSFLAEEIKKAQPFYWDLCRRLREKEDYLYLKYLGIVPAFLGPAVSEEIANLFLSLEAKGAEPCGIDQSIKIFLGKERERLEEILWQDLEGGFVIPDSWYQVLTNLENKHGEVTAGKSSIWQKVREGALREVCLTVSEIIRPKSQALKD